MCICKCTNVVVITWKKKKADFLIYHRYKRPSTASFHCNRNIIWKILYSFLKCFHAYSIAKWLTSNFWEGTKNIVNLLRTCQNIHQFLKIQTILSLKSLKFAAKQKINWLLDSIKQYLLEQKAKRMPLIIWNFYYC